MGIFINYISNIQSWMNDHIKSKIQQKTLFKQNVKNGKTGHDYENLQYPITELSDYVMERKNEYH